MTPSALSDLTASLTTSTLRARLSYLQRIREARAQEQETQEAWTWRAQEVDRDRTYGLDAKWPSDSDPAAQLLYAAYRHRHVVRRELELRFREFCALWRGDLGRDARDLWLRTERLRRIVALKGEIGR
ncbi:MAG: hypothetical protein OK454_11345, partial [Thaumarchaeota archaeon]|nr:hypothetical protein [Nitrososphaerota archaeon]